MKKKITINKITEIIEKASQKLSDDVIRRRLKIDKTIVGREEDITSKLETKLSEDLNELIAVDLQELYEGEIEFEVYPFKKTEESDVGADLCGIVDITHSGERVVKYFLAQSKVCVVKNVKGKTYYKGGDANLQGQVQDMLNLTSDSFVFIYSEEGIFVTPAFGIKLSGGKIDTRNQYYKSVGRFYAEFFKCFVGDHKANGQDLSKLTMEEIVGLIKSKFTHYIKINTEKNKEAEKNPRTRL